MSTSTSITFKGLLALVVDDEITARMVARRSLSQMGFEICEADDGTTALELVQSARPDVILLDVEMGTMDGFTTCQRLRENPALVNTPIIMLTAHDDPESIERAYLAGATDFASKPINWTLLQHRLKYVLRNSELVTDLASAQQIARMGSWHWTFNEDSIQWSDGLFQVLGTTLAQNAKLESIAHPDDQGLLSHGLQRARQDNTMDITHRIVRPDGTVRTVQHRAAPVHSHDGDIIGMTGSLHDVTEREVSLQRIQQLAYQDDISNLPNRRAFKEYLSLAIVEARRCKENLAVLYLDIDDFKRVNDSLGHSIGDLLLNAIGGRILEALEPLEGSSQAAGVSTSLTGPKPPRMKAARLGGDEFAVLLCRVGSEEEVVNLAESLLVQLGQPIMIEQHTVVATPSIGIAQYPKDADDSEALLKNADTAMYEAKHRGKNTYHCYDEALSTQAQRQLTLEMELSAALEKNELSLHYQPQIDVHDGHLVGAEALLRWNSGTLGHITPFEFIPVAEKTGLILPIGEWVLKTACTKFMQWRRDGMSISRIAVNISMRQFSQTGFVDRVSDVIQATNMEPTCLELELTESMLALDAQIVIDKLQKLKQLGVALSIDDFGTGYSSLSYLKQFPIDRLKIDRSFVKDIDHDESDIAITTAIIGVAHALDLGVVAEGVETHHHMNKLHALGCEEAQGYLISRPVPAAEFAQWLDQHEHQPQPGQLKLTA